ncbi:T9SS type A sorting domain-containing protein [candidate division KSB1 bacterium]|nr:T9SS type A sorting domain-containing protein [candidate division KSB1 bacterium]
MKKVVFLFVGIILIPMYVFGQETILYNFDEIPGIMEAAPQEGGNKAYINVEINTTNKQEGTGALRIDWQNEAWTGDGGWLDMDFVHPVEGGLYDFSQYENLVIWYYVEREQSVPMENYFNIILFDVGEGTAGEGLRDTEFWMAHSWETTLLDDSPGWHKHVVKLEDQGDAMFPWVPGSGSAFHAPKWGQTAEGNGVFDLDKIRGFTFEIVQKGTLFPQHEAGTDTVNGVLLLDAFGFEGLMPINLVLFDGIQLGPNVNMSTGATGSVEMTTEAAVSANKSIKWTTGDAVDGLNFDLIGLPYKNLTLNWLTDSLKFNIKVEAGIGDLTLSYYDANDGQSTYTLSEELIGFNGTWKQQTVALKDFTGNLDAANIKQFSINGAGEPDWAGNTIYLDNIWTGTPEIDVVPPVAVENIVIQPAEYYNIVNWQDIPDESGEIYNIYASLNPISDIDADGIEIVATGVGEAVQTVNHHIYFPLVDKSVMYYYAIQCADLRGNLGELGFSSSITNIAKAVPTISLNAPVNFVADGDFTEWDAAGIIPFEMTPDNNTVFAGGFSGEDDLMAFVYVAMDNDYLYIAVEVFDDVYNFVPEDDFRYNWNWWGQDAFEMFIGLYDERGKFHGSAPWTNTGAEPDLHFVLLERGFYNDYAGGIVDQLSPLLTPDDENYYFESFGVDYMIETKVSLDQILTRDDARFIPQNGMRLPFDLVFRDNDGVHEGNLALSPLNVDGTGEANPLLWTYTWLGDTTHIVPTSVELSDKRSIPKAYNLSQNYPNPFNPTTTIHYSTIKAGKVIIELYNITGQKVKTLVNQNNPAGNHRITVNTEELTAGIYFYSIKVGDFTQTKKMILMK